LETLGNALLINLRVESWEEKKKKGGLESVGRKVLEWKV